MMKTKTTKQTGKRKGKQQPRGAVVNVVQKPDTTMVNDFLKKLNVLIRNEQVRKRFSVVLNVAVFAVFIGGLVISTDFLKSNMYIEKVAVKGDFLQIDKRDIEAELFALVGKNYFDVDIQKIQKILESFSWLDQVEVRRVWPDTLLVVIKEHDAIARWGALGFINAYGEIIIPVSFREDLLGEIPDLSGSREQSELILSTYVQMTHNVKGDGLVINNFSLESNAYWRLGFNRGFELLLAKDREQEGLLRFLELYRNSNLFRQINPERIDMRYSNGFAVKQKTEGNVLTGSDVREKTMDNLGRSHG